MVTQSPAFKKAIEDSRKLKAKPTNDELLELYALFKTGTGEDFSKATQPGTFDFQGKYKYNAWKKVVEEDKTSPEDAQKNGKSAGSKRILNPVGALSTKTKPACFLHGPGDARYAGLPTPTLSSPHDVIIRIAFVGVCGSDVHFWSHGGIGVHHVTPDQPLVMGHEASGTVHAIGSSVTTLAPGDRVAMEPGFPCRRCVRCKEGRYNLCNEMVFAASPPTSHGTLCKYFRLPEDYCFKLPSHVSLEEGVLLEPASVAVHMARLVDVKMGQSVVVFGAGTVGLLSGAVAKAFGARKVVLVDILERKLEFAKTFVQGCETFIPDSKASSVQNAARLIEEHGLGDGADVVMEASGAEPSIQTGIHVLRVGGSYVQGGLGRPNIDFPIVAVSEKELTMKGCFRYSSGDFKLALDLISEGKLRVKELITKKVDFEQAIEAWETTKRGEGIKTLIKGVQDEKPKL